mmetsp:Transcript_24904/g.56405  ORF Transcript_24904/g.56405 Transcript_24904/m.56405 type:complete len:481 (+) Transcript_24904:102-1544(+)
MAPWRMRSPFLITALAMMAASEDTVMVEPNAVDEALRLDDQCAAGDEQCALSAIQLRGQKLLAREDAKESVEISGTCATYGCGGYNPSHACQCNGHCFRYGNCCPDYVTTCTSTIPAETPAGTSCSGGADKVYKLDWKAQGHTFFDNFTFMTIDEVHGANDLLTKQRALAEGIITADSSHAVMRTGSMSTNWKRKTVNVHTNYAWDPKKSFIAVMKYRHLPNGAGVWPGFWSMNSDILWPGGGELDILEYANDEKNKVSFHTTKKCFLDTRKLGKCMHGHGMGGPGPSLCETDYFHNLLGCRPQQKQQTGAWYSSHPGVIAAEWTEEFVKVFYIPEKEIPADLSSDAPKPETWDKFIISYLPFQAGTCQDLALPQELIINIQMCGDWAGGAWEKSPSNTATGWTSRYGICQNNIWDPQFDCCTKWIMSPAADSYLRDHAYFDIDYVKVFTQDAASASSFKKVSGTYSRGGQPLLDPDNPV